MAETAHGEIKAYASFPHLIASGTNPSFDPSNWHWVHCLTFPMERLNELQFSPRPYKWIRYAIGVVVGAHGDLSSSSNRLNIVDYNASLPTESQSISLYYHTSDDERQIMFPIDPNIGCTNVTSSTATTRRVQFCSDVAMRDGKQCVFTGLQELFCDAVHLLGHSKGDSYISTYTQHRSRDPAGGDIVQDIDDVRNGLFLNKMTHVGVDNNSIAFLPTPNFAMDTSDINPAAPKEEKRCTIHLFEPSEPMFLGGTGEVHSNSPIRISDTPDWPPAILFDAVYASTVLHHFGTQTLKDVVTATWMDAFDPGCVMTDTRPIARDRTQKLAQKRQTRHEARINSRVVPDTFDMLMALPYILVPPDELQATLREVEEKEKTAEQRRVQEKVDTWKRQVISP